MRRRRREDLSPIEVPIAASILTIVLGGSLTVFDPFGGRASGNGVRAETQDLGRRVAAGIVRELRAASTADATGPVVRAGAGDSLVIDRNPGVAPGSIAHSTAAASATRPPRRRRPRRSRRRARTARRSSPRTSASGPGSG